MVDAVVAEFGSVDILVNNGGIASRGQHGGRHRSGRVPARAGHARHRAPPPVRLVLPRMRTRPRGDIVMVSSVATRHYAGNGAPYNMGKAALEALAFTLAKEERANGIHVNVVAPGLVETDMGVRLAKAMGSPDIRALDAGVAVRPRVPAARRRQGRAVAVLGRVGVRHRPADRVRRRRPALELLTVGLLRGHG